MKHIFILLLMLQSIGTFAYTEEKAGFNLEVNGELNPYNIFSVFVMPGEIVNLKSTISLNVDAGNLKIVKNQYSWNISAPSIPGAYTVTIKSETGKKMQLNILVLTPLKNIKGEYLNGYRIGNYPERALRDNPIYNKPKGLFEVTKSNENLKLSPHFSLKQFLCKQESGYPKYLIVRELLLLKLEYILKLVNENGYAVETFGFISGYRTPYYNASIKNVQYSRHVYGGASDIIIDQNNDGSMDDLNKDGKIDEKDVRIFYNIVENEYNKPEYLKFRGGLGFYRKNDRHNGFIHVDVRGWRARW